MRKIVILCSAIALLTSCIGIDSRMTIKDNGSGTLSLTYRVSQLVSELGVSSTGRSAIPLPLSRSDFERALGATGGRVRLTAFDRSENDKDIIIRADLTFDSVDALARVDAFHDADLKLSTQGSQQTFSQIVARAPRQPLTDDSKRMLDALFDGYDLSFTVETPKPIKDSTLGTLSSDRKTLTYKTSVKDAVSAAQDLVLTASW